MKRKPETGKGRKVQRARPVRASISFPAGLYETLAEVAIQKKVSLAWVVREAAERYVASGSAGGPSWSRVGTR